MATKVFSLYRYQILPIQNQYNLLYDLDKLLEQKNSLFQSALMNLKISSKTNKSKRYNYEIARHDNDKFLLIVSREKSVKYYREDHVKAHISSYPPAHVIIDNNSEYQIVAVENTKEFHSTNTIIKMLETSLKKCLENSNLIVKISPIYQEKDFWEYVEKHKNDITTLKFSLITPNMSNISGNLCDDIKNLGKATRAAGTDYKLKAEQGSTLQIDKDNTAIAGMANYASRGGGETIVHLRDSKLSFKSNDYQLTIEIGELEISGSISDIVNKVRSKTNDDGPNR